MTMLEIMVVVTILVVALATYGSTIATLSMWGPINRENALALAAARGMVEELYSVPVGEAFARYNGVAGDDPGGAGTAPGSSFDVPGLAARDGDADGVAGEIIFPATGGQLREDLVDPDLGTPRDLNGDGLVDPFDHSGDYIILPVRIRLEWAGKSGDRALEVYAALAEL